MFNTHTENANMTAKKKIVRSLVCCELCSLWLIRRWRRHRKWWQQLNRVYLCRSFSFLSCRDFKESKWDENKTSTRIDWTIAIFTGKYPNLVNAHTLVVIAFLCFVDVLFLVHRISCWCSNARFLSSYAPVADCVFEQVSSRYCFICDLLCKCKCAFSQDARNMKAFVHLLFRIVCATTSKINILSNECERTNTSLWVQIHARLSLWSPVRFNQNRNLYASTIDRTQIKIVSVVEWAQKWENRKQWEISQIENRKWMSRERRHKFTLEY